MLPCTRNKNGKIDASLQLIDAANCPRARVAIFRDGAENEAMFREGQLVRVNLAGLQVQGVMFHAAVTDAVGNIVRETSNNPPAYLVRLLFSFKGVNEVDVPADRIRAA